MRAGRTFAVAPVQQEEQGRDNNERDAQDEKDAVVREHGRLPLDLSIQGGKRGLILAHAP